MFTQLHSSASLQSRFPALSIRPTKRWTAKITARNEWRQSRATKRAEKQHLKAIQRAEKNGLPPPKERKVRPVHQKTIRSTVPPYIAGMNMSEARILPFLATGTGAIPRDIVPGDWNETYKKYIQHGHMYSKESLFYVEEQEEVKMDADGIKKFVGMKQEAVKELKTDYLKLEKHPVPSSVLTKKIPEDFVGLLATDSEPSPADEQLNDKDLSDKSTQAKRKQEADLATLETLSVGSSEDLVKATSVSPPYYSHQLNEAELKFALNDTPIAFSMDSKMDPVEEQKSEIVRRILSLSNSNAEQLRKFNFERIIQLFGRRPFDTGSPEVQAAFFTIKIKAMLDHLEGHKKDIKTKRQLEAILGKRARILKYLKRKNLSKYVEMCKVLGVDPKSINC
ncbi:hypothetical protein HK098_007120 [Nowakowskiella sp. JEL0407]|nr:hypothetical protein HK098_007120 [Nowakowskiella sp. JEL0407]